MSPAPQASLVEEKPRRKVLSAMELVGEVVDTGSFQSWDGPPAQPDADPAYAGDLAAARLRSGSEEAVITGEALVAGTRTALIVGEFAFLAGSVGKAAAQRIITAVERATAEGLPLVASPASGGTRMQEGTAAFLSMVGITAALERHKGAGLLYLVYLRHPTTGGAMASWGALGQVTFAEPGALLGFLGPRVHEALHGTPFPPGVQSAENLHQHGLVDQVVPPMELRQHLATVLGYTAKAEAPATARTAIPAVTTPAGPPVGAAAGTGQVTGAGALTVAGPDMGAGAVAGTDTDAWEHVTHSRRPGRPGSAELLRLTAGDLVPLESGGPGGLLLALARLGTVRCVVVAQDRDAQAGGELIGPAGLRRAQRGMALAADLGLPLLTIVDTPGAELSVRAEEGGLAREIARCIAAMTALPVPTVSLVLGEGTGGAAIALLPADRVLCAGNGWLAPLPPEGASAIVHRSTGQAPALARRLGIRAADLRVLGVVDWIIDESPDAAEEPEAFCFRAAAALEQALAQVQATSGSAAERLRTRAEKYRRITMG